MAKRLMKRIEGDEATARMKAEGERVDTHWLESLHFISTSPQAAALREGNRSPLAGSYKTDEEYLTDLEKCAAEGDAEAKDQLMFYKHGGDVIELSSDTQKARQQGVS